MRHIICALLLALSTATSAQAGILGRLFFTSEQRAQLEQDYNTEGRSSALTVNGIVQKKGGARTAWINGVAQNAGDSDGRDEISLSGQSVKVGQKLMLYRRAPRAQ